jgi:glycosyltransferase involved in cell wall biosynthesis
MMLSAVFLRILLNFFPAKRRNKVNVFFGGARSGNFGGPQVKIYRLNSIYPETKFRFNLVYCISNSIFLCRISIFFLKLKKIPLILNQNGVFYPAWYSGDYNKMNARMAEVYHAADFVIWQSKFCKLAANKYLGYRNGPGTILYNGVDTCKFSPIDIRPNRPLTFLLTGYFNLHMFYRIQSSIEGFNQARKDGLIAELLIAGKIDNDTKKITYNLINKLRLKKYVKIIGEYTQSNAEKIYQLGDVYIHTKFLDPCPNSVIEAMSCGLPIIYSNSGGTAELVGTSAGVPLNVKLNEELGIQIPLTKDISNAMIKLSKNYQKIGKNARDRATSKFDIKIWNKKHSLIFESNFKFK